MQLSSIGASATLSCGSSSASSLVLGIARWQCDLSDHLADIHEDLPDVRDRHGQFWRGHDPVDHDRKPDAAGRHVSVRRREFRPRRYLEPRLRMSTVSGGHPGGDHPVRLLVPEIALVVAELCHGAGLVTGADDRS